jgi:outer membrane protein TolC
MATLNIPIWFNRIKADIDASKSSLEASKYEYENTQNELEAQLAMLHYKMKDSERQFKLYNDALVPKAVQTLNATKSGYEAGKMDFLSLIVAQRMLLNFQLALYRHNADYYQNVSKIRTFLGELK